MELHHSNTRPNTLCLCKLCIDFMHNVALNMSLVCYSLCRLGSGNILIKMYIYWKCSRIQKKQSACRQPRNAGQPYRNNRIYFVYKVTLDSCVAEYMRYSNVLFIQTCVFVDLDSEEILCNRRAIYPPRASKLYRTEM